MYTWIKKKYSCPKSRSGYKSAHNDGRRADKVVRFKRATPGMKAAIQDTQPVVVLHLQENGKRRFIRHG